MAWLLLSFLVLDSLATFSAEKNYLSVYCYLFIYFLICGVHEKGWSAEVVFWDTKTNYGFEVIATAYFWGRIQS